MKTKVSNLTQIGTSLFAAIFVFSSVSVEAKFVQDKITLPAFARVISFNELMALSSAKRASYIKGLRAIMREIETKRSNSGESKGASRELFSSTSQIARLLEIYDRTESEAVADPNVQTVSLRVPYLGRSGDMECLLAPGAVSKADPVVEGVPLSSGQSSSFLCLVGPRAFDSCKPGTISVKQTEIGNFSCATEESFRNLTSELKIQAKTPDSKGPYPEGDDGGKKYDPSVRFKTRSDGKIFRSADEIRAALQTKSDRPKSLKSEIETQKAPAASVSHAAGSGDHVQTITVAPEDMTAKDCAPGSETPKTCNAAEVESARRKYASDKSNSDCIYAGSISSYPDGKKHPYGCQAPTEFCFGSLDCSNEDLSRKKADYSCDEGKTICNPLIFGVQSDGKSPFCIDKGARATAACDDQSSQAKDRVSPLDEAHLGLKESWNEFTEHLNKLCHGDQIAAALHCEECDIISRRLFKLNMDVRDLVTCGQARKFQDVDCDSDGKCSRPGSSTESTRANKSKPAASRAKSSTSNTKMRSDRLLANANQ